MFFLAEFNRVNVYIILVFNYHTRKKNCNHWNNVRVLGEVCGHRGLVTRAETFLRVTAKLLCFDFQFTRGAELLSPRLTHFAGNKETLIPFK